MTGERMATEMAEQPQVLGAIAARFDELRQAVADVAPKPLSGVTFVARGSSDNAALLGRYAVELASGRPASLGAPSLHTRYMADVDYSGHLVVVLSQSGETPEIVATAQRLHERSARVVAITNDPTSSLGRAAEVSLAVGAGVERAVPATKTVTAQMLMVLAVAAAFGDIGVTAADLALLANEVEALLADEVPAADLAARWATNDRLLVAGRGLPLAACLETALKVRETARVFAQGISSADLLHGPIASVDVRLPVLVVDGGGPGSPELSELAARIVSIGADVAWCAIGRDTDLRLRPGLPEALQVLAATVRGQQLALAWSRAKGLDPDAPEGLSKVTPTH
jgi:glucosamine--fructose-6-phosphate aminotransferase (isomerizing)